MKLAHWLCVLGLLLVVGCLPNPVSVSKDGTIALTLSETGEYELIQGEGRQVYLTNASADFLEKVEGLDKCRMPVISPSGKYVLACSDKELLLHDRKTKKTRAIYRARDDNSDGAINFPVWSPDERKIAFFAEGFGPDELPALCVYDVARRETEVLLRRASPQAAWLPDSKRLVYVSLPHGVVGNGVNPFGDLNVIHITTQKERTLARGQVFWLSGVAVFPEGNAVLFPCADWEGADLVPTGMSVPVVLRKELLPVVTQKTAPQPAGAAQNEGVPGGGATESQAGGGQIVPAAAERKEESLVLEEGQPFFPMTCAVSPDGKKIAYVRYVWDGDSAVAERSPGETESASAAEQKEGRRRGLEFCVARADGTGIVALLRRMEKDNAQVLWIDDSRLLCVADDEIVAVGVDGKTPAVITEVIKTKFADRLQPTSVQEETGPGR